MTVGIYTITSKIDNKIYVGCSKNVRTRLKKHENLLRQNKHINRHLQSAWNCYKESNFIFEILVECEEQHIYSEENYWCNLLNVHDANYGYNTKPTSPMGRSGHSKETIEKMRIGNSKPKPLINKALLQFDLAGNFIKEWESISNAAKTLGLFISPIINACNGKKLSSGNYIWRYKKNFIPNSVKPVDNKKSKPIPICQYDINGNLLATYPTIDTAVFLTGLSKSAIAINIYRNYNGTKYRCGEFIFTRKYRKGNKESNFVFKPS